ncbi:MAG: ABC transporter permease [Gammaproteobacteria bacterium]|nr:ABC transporter permease [Gammaproteobacteria bacterium]
MNHFSYGAFCIWQRNILVWKKLIGPALMLHFGEPLIYLFGLGYGIGQLVGDINGISYVSFLATGIIASSAMTTASLEGTYSVFTRMVPQQTYKAILTTPIKIEQIIAGEFLWCANKALFSSTAILIIATLLGLVESWQALWVFPIILISSIAFAAPAIIVAALSPSYDYFNYYFTLAVTPMFILCGVFYPISSMPSAMQIAVQFLPLTHTVELVRPLMLGQDVQNTFYHIAILLVYAGAGTILAMHIARKKFRL